MSRFPISSFLFALIVIYLGHASASAEDGPCDKSPISYDLSGYSAEQEQSCDMHAMSAAEFDKDAANELFKAFGILFMPPETTIWTAQFGGDGWHYGFAHLARAKQPISLSSKEIHAAIDASVNILQFSKEPGRVEWHGTAEVDGYAVEFYYSEQSGMFGAVSSECMILTRYPDGSAKSHKTRIVATYCEAATGTPLDAAKAHTAIAMIRHRPELMK